MIELHDSGAAARQAPHTGLEFLWLELTHRCNLQCVHCYSDSTPYTGERDLLKQQDYRRAMADARALGCRALQFIGGEPTLNRGLADLIAYARELGFEQVEVFTNLVALPEPLLESFRANDVAVATSFHAADADAHDRVTATAGSHARTVANLRRIIAAGLHLRVAVVSDQPYGAQARATHEFLRELGVTRIGTDHVRAFGRGAGGDDGDDGSMGELCGNCAGRVLAIGPDGVVSPCIMSRRWQVGSLAEQSLAEIVDSERLLATRAAIATATARDRTQQCGPDPNCGPNCSPNAQCGPCAPNGGWKCLPNGNCNPGQ